MKYSTKEFFNHGLDQENLCFKIGNNTGVDGYRSLYNTKNVTDGNKNVNPALTSKTTAVTNKKVDRFELSASGKAETAVKLNGPHSFIAQLEEWGLNDKAIEAIVIRAEKPDVENNSGLRVPERRLDGVTYDYALLKAEKIKNQAKEKGLDPNEVILNSLRRDGGVDFTKALESDSLSPIDREKNYDAFIIYLENSGITPDNQNPITARIDKSEAQSGGQVPLTTAFYYMRTIVDKSQQKGLDVNKVIKQSLRPGAGIDFEKALSIVERANAKE